MFDRGVVLWSWKFDVWQGTGFVVIEVSSNFYDHKTTPLSNIKLLWPQNQSSVKHQTSRTTKSLLCQTSNFYDHKTTPLSNIKHPGPQNHSSVKHQTSMTTKPLLCQTSNFQDHKTTPLSNIKLLWPQNQSFVKHDVWQRTGFVVIEVWCLTEEWFCGPGSLMFDKGLVLWS
jgi:hypothetical protein